MSGTPIPSTLQQLLQDYVDTQAQASADTSAKADADTAAAQAAATLTASMQAAGNAKQALIQAIQ